MNGDEELIERLRRTLIAEADAITPRREPSGPAPAVRPLPNGSRRPYFGRLPWAIAAAAAVAAAATLLAINWPGSSHNSQIGITATSTQAPSTTIAPATTVPASPTTVRTAAPPAAVVPVPSGFTPASVTFVSPRDGWAAGTYPCGPMLCVTVARTYDGGSTWSRYGGPPVPALPNAEIGAAPGIVSLRFADVDDGWLYTGNGQSQQLWSTHDGGQSWQRVVLPVPNATIDSLETSAGIVYAAVLDLSDATVHIESSPVSVDSWTDVATGLAVGAGPVPDAQLVLQGTTGWLIENDRTVVGGLRLSAGKWSPWPPPCTGANGTAALAAPTVSNLQAVCMEGVMGPAQGLPAGAAIPSNWLYTSGNGGTAFSRKSEVPVSGGSLVSGATPNTVVASGWATGHSTSGGLFLSSDAGRTWRHVYTAPVGQTVLYLGFTTPTQGVAIVAGNRSSTLVMTYNGGVSWSPVAF